MIQCMHTGLIPLVTREAGIDTDDFGMTFADDSIEAIEHTIRQVAGLPDAWHRERSLKTRAISEQNYSEDSFVTRWREILSEVLADDN